MKRGWEEVKESKLQFILGWKTRLGAVTWPGPGISASQSIQLAARRRTLAQAATTGSPDDFAVTHSRFSHGDSTLHFVMSCAAWLSLSCPTHSFLCLTQ